MNKHVQEIKNKYAKGTRIKLTKTMDDIQPILANQKGTVLFVDDIGTLHMKWDNGRGLGIVVDEDEFEMI